MGSWRRRRNILFVLKWMAGFICFGLLAFAFFFRVESVEVMGSSRYTEEEICAMVLTGPAARNTLLASRFLSRKMPDIPYVESVKVAMVSPTALNISVREQKPVGCFAYLDSYIYFDQNGLMIDGSYTHDPDILCFSDISVTSAICNEKLDFKTSEYDSLDYSEGLVTDTAVVLNSFFQKKETKPENISIDASKRIILQFGPIRVNLGQNVNLEDKLNRVVVILPMLAGKKGTLHAETVTEENKRLTFEPVSEEASATEENMGSLERDKIPSEGEEADDQEGSAASEPASAPEMEIPSEVTSSSKPDYSELLDVNGDGVNDYTGELMSETDVSNISFLDEDRDGLNDFTLEPLNIPGVSDSTDTEESEPPEEEGSTGDSSIWE